MPCSAHPLSDTAWLLTEETREANVRYLRSYIAALERKNPAEMAHMGIPDDYDASTATPLQRVEREAWIKHSIDVGHWTLCKALRWSVPRRLVEAIPSLTWLLNWQKDEMDLSIASRDLNMSMFLGVALSDAGRVAEAETVFELLAQTLARYPDALSNSAIMWMKANHARNLRFLGRIDEAIPLEKWVADDVNSTPHQYMPDDIYQRIMAPGDDPLNHPILNLIPYIRGTRVLHIKLNQGYPLRPYDVATGETVYLTRGQARDLLSAKKNFCDNNPKLDLEMTLHTQGEMKGKTETRGTPKLRHDPPVKNVVCVRYLPNGQPYTWELPLPGDPFEIDQEEVKECWLTRCGKTKDLKLCTKCYTARYCSQEHQAKAWKLHKVNCKAIYRVGTMGESKAALGGAGEKGKKTRREEV